MERPTTPVKDFRLSSGVPAQQVGREEKHVAALARQLALGLSLMNPQFFRVHHYRDFSCVIHRQHPPVCCCIHVLHASIQVKLPHLVVRLCQQRWKAGHVGDVGKLKVIAHVEGLYSFQRPRPRILPFRIVDVFFPLPTQLHVRVEDNQLYPVQLIQLASRVDPPHGWQALVVRDGIFRRIHLFYFLDAASTVQDAMRLVSIPLLYHTLGHRHRRFLEQVPLLSRKQ